MFVQINATKGPTVRSIYLTKGKVELGAIDHDFFGQTSSYSHIPSRAEKVGDGIFRGVKADRVAIGGRRNREIVDGDSHTVLLAICI